MSRSFRNVAAVILTLTALDGSAARAAWSTAGDPVCVAPGAQHSPICLLPWIVWTDERSGTPQLYATLLDWRTGEPVRTPVNGVAIAPSSSSQATPAVGLATLDGSLIVAWSEDRGTGSGPDLYAMRLRLSDGLPDPSWPAGGLRLCGASGAQSDPRILVHYDSTDPFHPVALCDVTWEDARDGVERIYATDLAFTGAVDPAWPVDGLLVSAGDGAHRNVALVREGNGFATIWESAGVVAAQAVSKARAVPANSSWPRTFSDVAFVASGAKARQVYVSSPLGDHLTVVSWLEQHGDAVQIHAQGWWGGSVNNLAPTAITVVDDENARPREIELLLPEPYNDRIQLYWRDERSDGGDLYSSILHATSHYPPPYPYLYLYATPASVGEPFVVDANEQSLVTGMRRRFWQDERSGVPQIHTESYGPVAATGFAQTQPSASWATGEGWIPESPPPPDVVVWTDARNAATAPDIYAQVGGPTAVGVPMPRVPSGVECSSPRPLPTTGAVAFELKLPGESRVGIEVIDVTGRVVRTVFRDRLPAGEHPFTWDGRDADGSVSPPGLYWIRGRAGEQSFRERVVMLSR